MVMAVPCHHLIPREDPEPRKVPPFTAELLHIRRKPPRPIPPFKNNGQGRRELLVAMNLACRTERPRGRGPKLLDTVAPTNSKAALRYRARRA
jgi:hypothetical protein